MTTDREAERAEIVAELSKAQRRVLRDLAGGGCFFGAFREPGDFMADGVLFSEIVGIVVHRPGGLVEDRYRVRNKTVAPLYLATPELVNHAPGDSGFRCFDITDAGRDAIERGDHQKGSDNG